MSILKTLVIIFILRRVEVAWGLLNYLCENLVSWEKQFSQQFQYEVEQNLIKQQQGGVCYYVSRLY